jgi:3'-5' exoribonuclease
MKQAFVGSLKAGESVDDIFVLADKNLAQKRDGANYLNVTLADKTGQVKGVVWDNVDHIVHNVASGDFVRAKGSISEYRGALQFVVKDMTVCSPDEVVPADFLAATTRDVEKMFARLTDVTASIEDPFLKRLFELFWQDDTLAARFKKAPAAKKMHHAYIGGLLEHTLSMVLLADRIAGHYSGLDRDLLIAGAVLHDIGKVDEFEYSSRIEYSDEGRLISHIVIAIQMLEEKLREIDAYPRERANLLKHMIISHHGAREFGSPEPPKTIEAVLLHFIDEIDSKVNGIREFMASEDPDENWTAYHRLLERHFYRGK